jgi:glycosyltransferase involved in cell wall biosynthesis
MNERLALNEMDVGLMPMPDDPWTRGKCGYKILLYFAAQLPAIASPVGVNRELVGSERGVLASTEEEWIRAFEQLSADLTVRIEMGSAGREFAQREYSYNAWAPRIADLIKSVVPG